MLFSEGNTSGRYQAGYDTLAQKEWFKLQTSGHQKTKHKYLNYIMQSIPNVIHSHWPHPMRRAYVRTCRKHGVCHPRSYFNQLLVLIASSTNVLLPDSLFFSPPALTAHFPLQNVSGGVRRRNVLGTVLQVLGLCMCNYNNGFWVRNGHPNQLQSQNAHNNTVPKCVLGIITHLFLEKD